MDELCQKQQQAHDLGRGARPPRQDAKVRQERPHTTQGSDAARLFQPSSRFPQAIKREVIVAEKRIGEDAARVHSEAGLIEYRSRFRYNNE